MDPATWHEALRVRAEVAVYHDAHAVRAGRAKGTFLISATRLGGQHGYDEAGSGRTLGGAVTGFTKAYKRERI